MEEIWKPIEGYEGLYEVSNLGRIKSLSKWRNHVSGKKVRYKEKELKPGIDRRGYHFVHLRKDGSGKSHRVHRLVALAFVPNDDPTNKTTVNHKNEIKTDNRVENLEWMALADNIRYGTRTVRIAAALGKPVVQYDKQGNEITRYPSVAEAARQTGFNGSNICTCCCGKCKQAYDFVWKYEEDVK